MVRFADPLKRNGRHNVGFQDKFFREKERGHALGVEILARESPPPHVRARSREKS